MMRGRGFSLTETLFSALILAVVIFLVVSLFPTSILGIKKGHDLVAASHVAEGVLGRLRAVPFEDLADLDPEFESGEVVVDGTVFHWDVRVTRPEPKVHGLEVNVEWQTGPRRESGAGSRSLSWETRRFHFDNP